MAGRNMYSDPILVRVIDGTNTALQEMERINRRVVALSAEVPQVNKSDSGRRLGAAFQTWSTEYGRVVSDLQQLNGKAEKLLQENRNTDASATDQANKA